MTSLSLLTTPFLMQPGYSWPPRLQVHTAGIYKQLYIRKAHVNKCVYQRIWGRRAEMETEGQLIQFPAYSLLKVHLLTETKPLSPIIHPETTLRSRETTLRCLEFISTETVTADI